MVDRINVTKVSFKCNNCGKCCRLRGDIVLYPMDIIRISNFLNISCKDFLEKYTITLESSTILSQIVIKSKNDKFLTCVFLNKKNMCRIYEVRPIACSNFPFLILNENTYLVQMVPCVQDFNNGSKHILNNNGDSGHPCLTPFSICISLLSCPLTEKLVVLLLYKFLIKPQKSSGKPIDVSALYINLCETLPNASAKSIVTM